MPPTNQAAPHQTYIKDACGDKIAIGTEPGANNVVIRGDFDVWHFKPDQAVDVAHAILGYVNEITGDKPRYVVGTITTAEPAFLYAPEDEDTGAQL